MHFRPTSPQPKMISTSGTKSQDLIARIQSHEEPARALKGLFSPEEIEVLRCVALSSYEKTEHTQKKLIKKDGQALGNMAHPRNEDLAAIESMVRSKVETYMPHKYKMAFTFHRNYFPYGTHTDSGYDDSEFIYKQGIIPLEIDPPDQDVYTVIFAQKAYHSISYPGKVETIQALKPEELSLLHNFDRKHTLSDSELSELFQGPQDRERFRGFQVDLPFRWKLGDMALWDRAHLHCSSDFSGHGIQGKIGLMWISWRV